MNTERKTSKFLSLFKYTFEVRKEIFFFTLAGMKRPKLKKFLPKKNLILNLPSNVLIQYMPNCMNTSSERKFISSWEAFFNLDSSDHQAGDESLCRCSIHWLHKMPNHPSGGIWCSPAHWAYAHLAIIHLSLPSLTLFFFTL